MNKLLTIIIPSYNMEKYLPATIGGLMIPDEKLRTFLEVIVVNDGSRDRTSEIGHQYEHRYPDVVRVIDKENGHYGSCVNVGLAQAKGTFVKILDADDQFLSDGLTKLLRRLKQFEGVTTSEMPDLIVTDFCTIDDRGVGTGGQIYGLPEGRLFDVSCLATIENGLMHYACTYRTALLRDMSYRQSTGISYTDIEWLFLPMMHVERISYCPAIVYQYLYGRDGQSVSQYKKNNWMLVKVLDVVLDSYENRIRLFADSRNAYLQQVIYHVAKTLMFNYFFVCPMRQLNAELPRIDSRLKELMPKFWRQLENVAVPRRGQFKYYYVRSWRRRQHLPCIVILMLRLYIRHAAKIGAFLNLLQRR